MLESHASLLSQPRQDSHLPCLHGSSPSPSAPPFQKPDNGPPLLPEPQDVHRTTEVETPFYVSQGGPPGGLMVPPCRPERKIYDMEKAGYYGWLTLVGETGWRMVT